MLVHRRVTPSIKFAGTHLFTWVERGTVRVKCLAQEHNTNRSILSGVKHSNHEATAPPTLVCKEAPENPEWSREWHCARNIAAKLCYHCAPYLQTERKLTVRNNNSHFFILANVAAKWKLLTLLFQKSKGKN